MLTKTGIDISFAQGLDTKTDPKRVEIGKFLSLENSIFDKGGLLQKRNGFGQLAALPSTNYAYLTTFNGNLTAIGSNIAAFNAGNSGFVSKGTIQPLSVDTLPLIRNNLNQTQCDAVVAPNGLVCTVYRETDGTTTTAKYAVADSTTGQNVVAPAAIPVASGTVTGGMRVFYLGTNFVIVFTNVITAVSHLQYVTVSANNPTIVGANTDIAANYASASTLAWDGFVAGSSLYLAYNTTSGGQQIKVTYLNSSLVLATAVSFASYKATMMSVTCDTSSPASVTVYVSFFATSPAAAYTIALDQSLNTILAPVRITTSTLVNIASAAQGGYCQVFGEIANNYSYDAAIPSHTIISRTVTPAATGFQSVFSSGAGTITVSSAAGLVNGMQVTDITTPANIAPSTTFTVSGTTLTLGTNTAGNSAGSPGDTLSAASVTTSTVIRSVGLASKAFIVGGQIYFLAAHQSPYQSTYFLVAGTSTSAAPVIAAKLAYQNGGGYLTLGLPGVTVSGSAARVPYLFKDLIQAVNKSTNPPTGTAAGGIYSQTGINLGTFTLGTGSLDSSEIGNDLHLSGGFLWMYDGYLPVEHNFLLWPASIEATWSATGGAIAAKPDGLTNTNAYWYQVTYEWTDNQGNAFRSAPSVPISVTTTGSGTAGSITVNIPTLRLTMKTANPVKIVIYRWSLGQQFYYQTTSITAPTLNDTTVDSIAYVDTLADASILGNNLIYTTGGVAEDVNAPASDVMALFDTRLWLVDAEDRNLLWFSKQVIEATPVEMSDLLTVYVPPTVGTQGSTGPIRSLAAMDDKLIIGKENALLYINGTGPDNTGANSQYSQPIFITSTVGCANQRSIVLMPGGLMFQSDKGIWLLDRGLNTTYIGAPVQDFTLGATVLSAVNVPETNQVRFTLDTGVTLMYDYYYQQWGSFVGVPCVSSCIFQGLHTFINKYGAAFQETPGAYLDGSRPVLMSFKTGPVRLGELQGYQRVYFFYLLGQYLSPHRLQILLTYDYETGPTQSIILTPANYSAPYGSGTAQSPYGQGDPYGGPSALESWRVFPERQRCMAFSITLNEIFDPSFGVPAGAGLTLSGLNVVAGFKRPFRPQPAATSAA